MSFAHSLLIVAPSTSFYPDRTLLPPHVHVFKTACIGTDTPPPADPPTFDSSTTLCTCTCAYVIMPALHLRTYSSCTPAALLPFTSGCLPFFVCASDSPLLDFGSDLDYLSRRSGLVLQYSTCSLSVCVPTTANHCTSTNASKGSFSLSISLLISPR